MKTILDTTERESLIARIDTLTEKSVPAWGTMNVYQMVEHCIRVEEMYLGKKQYKASFLGKIIGRIILKKMLKDDKPMRHNAPTGEHFKVAETSGDFAAAKQLWISLIREYEQYALPSARHWFFGMMNKEQVGYLDYKHIDHHLRQFSA